MLRKPKSTSQARKKRTRTSGQATERSSWPTKTMTEKVEERERTAREKRAANGRVAAAIAPLRARGEGGVAPRSRYRPLSRGPGSAAAWPRTADNWFPAACRGETKANPPRRLLIAQRVDERSRSSDNGRPIKRKGDYANKKRENVLRGWFRP